MRIYKCTISLLLTILIIVGALTSLPFIAGAAEITETNTINTEEIINKISKIEINDKTAYVDLQTYVDAILVVALYDDEGLKMYTSARSEITTENSSVELTFDIETMPEYYLIKAYLLDSTTYKPVSNAFICDTYTLDESDDSKSGLVTTGICGEDVYYDLYDDGLFIIYGLGDKMYDYSYYDSKPWDSYCDSIVKVISKGIDIGSRAFYNCKNLTSVDLDYYMEQHIESIGEWAFGLCKSLTSITIPDSVSIIGDYAFCGCTGLTDVTIGCNVESIGRDAFNGCNHIKSITIPDSVTSIGEQAFYRCSNLSSVTIGNGLKSISNGTFNQCSKLRNVVIGNNVEIIGNYAFYLCKYLKSITIPDSVKSIGSSTFEQCHGIKSVILGDSLESIGSDAFSSCGSLRSIYISDSLVSVEARAFSGCADLDIYYKGNYEQWTKINISSYNNALTEGTIHYISSPNEIQVQSYIQNTDKNVETVGADAIKTFTKTNLEAGTEVVLIIFEGLTEEIDVLTTPILYIAQATADETGTATFSAYCDLDNKYWTACVYGYCNHSSTHTEVKEATRGTDGLELTICDHCGEIIESTVIPKTGVLGDVNGDGDVTADDVTLIQKYLAYIIDFSEDEMNLADTDQDGEVTIDDATRIQKYIAQVITEL